MLIVSIVFGLSFWLRYEFKYYTEHGNPKYFKIYLKLFAQNAMKYIFASQKNDETNYNIKQQEFVNKVEQQ